MSLFRIVYVSDVVGDVSDPAPLCGVRTGAGLMMLIEILGASNLHNRRDHVTGALLLHQGRFLQVIEGGRADLDRLMRRLRADPRHANMQVLRDGPAAGRLFGDWTMGALTPTPALTRFLAGDLGAPDAADQASRLMIEARQAMPASSSPDASPR